MSDRPASRRSNFLTDIVDADLAAGRHTKVVTRFPPEPNGYLHIGHAKSIALNFGLADQYGGVCHLRLDDTNPVTEDTDYVESIQHDVAWLGGNWDGEVRYASNYFGQMYALAERLVTDGKAYVDGQTVEEIRKNRGDFTTPGVASPYRDRPIEESLDLLRRMKAGEFADGTCVLRARIDMGHANVLMRDPLIYRIRHAHHHRTGDEWCIYPMYDYAHPLEDAIEGITHSICTLEFETNRELYDWFLDHTGPWSPRPRQYEFARLALGYTVMSKRKLLQLVVDKRVSGWDDPRMPTVAGMRRRGVTPEALRDFADLIGVAKNNSMVDIGKLEFCIRQDLEKKSPRALAVLKPLAVTLTNWPADMVEKLNIPWWPSDPSKGSRVVPFAKHLMIERDDFSEEPPADWKRLAPGREVRLYGAYFVKCDSVDRDPITGAITGLRCTVDLHTKGGTAPDGRQPAATLHWVAAKTALDADVRLYDRLFSVEQPDAEGDFLAHLNTASLEVLAAKLEPALAQANPGERFQFVRQGFFVADAVESLPGAPVWNRTISLRDTWARPTAIAKPASRTAADKPAKPQSTAASDQAVARLAWLESEPELKALCAKVAAEPAAFAAFAQEELAVAFLRATLAAGADPETTFRWQRNELAGALASRKLAAAPFDAKAFAAFIGLVNSAAVTPAAAKRLLDHLCDSGGDPLQLVDQLGLRKMEDDGALEAAVRSVLDQHAGEVARYRAGETKLLPVLLGATMRAARGADAQAARATLLRLLAS
jgi:glutaminyl-tRNA synthetase